MKKKKLFRRGGVKTSASVMENGESRFRMDIGDSSYILTRASAERGAWQNAHFHQGVIETYIVEKGYMGFVVCDSIDVEESTVRIIPENGIVQSQIGESHNVFLPEGAVIHTVKHGIPIGNPKKNDADWYPASTEFDIWTKELGETQMRILAEMPSR